MLRLLELSILLFSYRGLHLVEGLFDELTILNVQDSISVAFNVWIMGHHHARGSCFLTVSLWSNPVDIQDEVHDRD